MVPEKDLLAPPPLFEFRLWLLWNGVVPGVGDVIDSTLVLLAFLDGLPPDPELTLRVGVFGLWPTF